MTPYTTCLWYGPAVDLRMQALQWLTDDEFNYRAMRHAPTEQVSLFLELVAHAEKEERYQVQSIAQPT